jgi:hypothetical protein
MKRGAIDAMLAEMVAQMERQRISPADPAAGLPRRTSQVVFRPDW